MSNLDKQQGSVLLLCLLVLGLSLQIFLSLFEQLVDIGGTLQHFKQVSIAQQSLFEKAMKYHQFDFEWQDLGQYDCIVICKPECFGTHHGLVRLRYKPLTLILRVAEPVQGLQCQKRHSIQLPSQLLYFRFEGD